MNPKVHGPGRTKGADSFHGNGFPARRERPEWPTVEHKHCNIIFMKKQEDSTYENAKDVVAE
jgi:hypothetical protein